MSQHEPDRVQTSVNIGWTPRPGWATVRLIGTCADRSLRRGQVVEHARGDEFDALGKDEGLQPGAMVIILSDAARLVEDDLHLVPEVAIVAVGELLP
jgi:hypothetical protein